MLEPLTALALIVLLGVTMQWLANRVGVPSILFLLAAGILVGPVTGVVQPDLLFGDLLFPVVSLAVAIVLFEGGTNLRFSEFRSVRTEVLALTTLGVLVTWAGSTAAAWWLFGFHAEVAALLGAILVVTGPTVVIPLLRGIDASERFETIATWEGIVNDPLGAVLTITVYEATVPREAGSSFADAAVTIAETLGIGAAAAAVGTVSLVAALQRDWISEHLVVPGTLGVVLAAFAGAEALSPEAGLVATTLLGVGLANQTRVDIDEILRFKESLSVILIGVLFVILAARFEVQSFRAISVESGLFLALLLLVIRPVSVAVAGAVSGLKWRETLGLSTLGARGIVAAALASLFAIKLAEAGYPEARQLDGEVFFVIAGSVVFSSLIAGPLIEKLES